jgi:transposase
MREVQRKKEKNMPRFKGLTDTQWGLIEPMFPKSRRVKPGRIPTSDRKVMNTLLWLVLSSARWCDVPEGESFASRPAAWRRFDGWRHDGTIAKVFGALRDLARLSNQIDWERIIFDGSFSPDERARKARRVRPQGQGVHGSHAGG